MIEYTDFKNRNIVRPCDVELFVKVNGEMMRIPSPPEPTGYVLVSKGPNSPPEWVPKDEIDSSQ